MSIVLQSSGGGSVTLQEAVTASNLTITVPAVTGTMAIDGPAFSAYQNTAQTGISTVVPTKVTFDTEEFDTNNNFASSRFTPTVAGYYQISAAVTINSTLSTISCLGLLYKNGTQYKNGSTAKPSTSNYATSSVSTLVYLNGSTDYVELYVYGDVGSTFSLIASTTANTYINGSMVRAA
jgi:hypothetical protein